MTMINRNRLLTLFSALLISLIFILIIFLVVAAVNTPVSFDGAMNLQVAKSLAIGEGYAREYHGLRFFPHEIQTNIPFVVPAALLFSIFNVTIPTAQIINLLYIFILCGAFFLYVKNKLGFNYGCLIILAVLTAPKINSFGLNGYGELIAACWCIVSAVLLFSKEHRKTTKLRIWIAGVCLGLAILTKTVMLIGVVGIGISFLTQQVIEKRSMADVFIRVIFLILACFTVIALAEFWRYFSLSGWSSYKDWWAFELSSVQMQAGVTLGYADTLSMTSKIDKHLTILSGFVGLNKAILVFWIVAPLLLFVPIFKNKIGSHRWFLFALLIITFLYFLWFLGITPTSKAWHRRIYVAIVLQNTIWIFILSYFWKASYNSFSLKASILVFVGSILTFNIVNEFYAIDKSRDNYINKALDVINKLPDDAVLFGYRWHSAPTLALYSNRNIVDIELFTSQQLAALGTGYFLIDFYSFNSNIFSEYLDKYETHELLIDNKEYKIYKVDFTKIKSNNNLNKKNLSVLNEYKALYGFYPKSVTTDPQWVRTDAKLVFPQVTGKEKVYLRIWRPDLPYIHGYELSVQIYINDCFIGTLDSSHAGAVDIELLIPPPCKVFAHSENIIDLKANNIIRHNFPRDLRQLSYILDELSLRK